MHKQLQHCPQGSDIDKHVIIVNVMLKVKVTQGNIILGNSHTNSLS